MLESDTKNSKKNIEKHCKLFNDSDDAYTRGFELLDFAADGIVLFREIDLKIECD